MTVAQLIEKLKTLPQDMTVERVDTENGPTEIDEAQVFIGRKITYEDPFGANRRIETPLPPVVLIR
jgi:hypothetical protein